MSIESQPISAVVWRPCEQLHANDYNPNHVARRELELLAVSILEDGWTQPVVIRPHPDREGEFEIVDGFHRWTLAHTHPEVAALTDQQVPTVLIAPDPVHQRMSTIRHNRARGSHHVVKMADIVADVAEEVDAVELGRRLGMEAEEVDRLLARGRMIERGARETMGEAWRSAPK